MWRRGRRSKYAPMRASEPGNSIIACLYWRRGFTPSLHGDFNLGLNSLTRQGAVGTDTQFQATASFTLPLKGGHWAYTNELVYNSPLNGVRASLTTMHGLTYAVRRYDVYDVAVHRQLCGGRRELGGPVRTHLYARQGALRRS